MSKVVPILHLNSWVPALLSLVIRPAAVTIGRHIFVRGGVEASDRLLRHEAVHVLQFEELGLLRFGWFYVLDWLRARWALRWQEDAGAMAYRAIRLEQEARALEDKPEPWREVWRHREREGWRHFSVGE